MRSARKLPTLSDITEGAAIANAKGIPGTLGCLALTRDDDRLVFLTSHHVLFGVGAKEQNAVWLAARDNRDSMQPVARTRHGRCGTVTDSGTDIFVDCAVAEVDPRLVPQEYRIVPEGGGSTPVPGDRVSKTGAGTGRTEGIVVDTNYTDTIRVAGRKITAAGQILARPVVPGDIFSASGDSGAVLRSADGAVIGLLWGVDARGFGLACPIAPVLWVLHLYLAYITPKATWRNWLRFLSPKAFIFRILHQKEPRNANAR